MLTEFFPLHDATSMKHANDKLHEDENSMRRDLHKNWSMYHNLFTKQPLSKIKEGDSYYLYEKKIQN